MMNDLVQVGNSVAPPTELLFGEWYPALRAAELRKGKTKTLLLLGIPLLMGRRNDGKIFAMRDLCPHRGIPLSAGWFDGETVQCKYHGWRFEPCSGQCAEIPSLTGDMTLNSDELRVTGAKGSVRVTTKSKDVDLSQIYGDTYVENRNGRIAIAPAGSYNVEAKNEKGDVELTLPPNVSATLNGTTRNGEAISDFPVTVTGDERKTVSGRIGAGTAKIQLSTENGDLNIKRAGEEPPAVPATPAQPEVSPKAPHLKAPNTPPPAPVTQ